MAVAAAGKAGNQWKYRIRAPAVGEEEPMRRKNLRRAGLACLAAGGCLQGLAALCRSGA